MRALGFFVAWPYLPVYEDPVGETLVARQVSCQGASRVTFPCLWDGSQHEEDGIAQCGAGAIHFPRLVQRGVWLIVSGQSISGAQRGGGKDRRGAPPPSSSASRIESP